MRSETTSPPPADGGQVLGAYRRNLLASRLLKVGDALVANEDEVNIDVLGLELSDARLGLLDGRRVVRAAQTAVASDHHKANLLGDAGLKQRDVKGLRLEALEQATEDTLERLRERARAEHSLLRTAHLGRRHKLHRGGDLLRVLDGADAVTQLANGGAHLRDGRASRLMLGRGHHRGLEGRRAGDARQGQER